LLESYTPIVSIPASHNAIIPAATNPAAAPKALTDFIQLAALAVDFAVALDVPDDAVPVPLAVAEAVPFPLVACVQMSAVTVTALAASAVSHDLTKQGATDAVMAALPVVHWQRKSEAEQDVCAIAVVKQRMEHPGRSAIVYAVASDEAARKIAEIENFMVP